MTSSGKRQTKGTRRGRTLLGLTVVVAVAVVGFSLASVAFVAASPSSTSGLQTAATTGDYITYHCTNSQITAGGVMVCNNQASAQVDSCGSGYCTISVGALPLGGHHFKGWQSNGDAFFGCGSLGCGKSCSTAQGSLVNPDTLCMYVPNPGNKYAGGVTAVVG
jgi:hypothetical protein